MSPVGWWVSAIRADRVRRVDAASPTLYASPNAVVAPKSRHVDRVTAKTRFGVVYRVEGSKSRNLVWPIPDSIPLAEPSPTVMGRYNIKTDRRGTELGRFRPVVGGRCMPTGRSRHAPRQIVRCLPSRCMTPVGVSGMPDGRARDAGGTPPRPSAAGMNGAAPAANGRGMSRNGDARAPSTSARSRDGAGRSDDAGGSRGTQEGTRRARRGRVRDGSGRAPHRGGRPGPGHGAASDAGGKVVNGRRPASPRAQSVSGAAERHVGAHRGAERNGDGPRARDGGVASHGRWEYDDGRGAVTRRDGASVDERGRAADAGGRLAERYGRRMDAPGRGVRATGERTGAASPAAHDSGHARDASRS